MSKEGFNLIIALLYSISIAFSAVEMYVFIPLIFLAFVHKAHLLAIFKRLLLLNVFIIFLVLVVLFQDHQEAWQLFLRTNAILLFNLFLFYQSKGYDIVRGCYALKMNKKFVALFYVTISLIEYLFCELKNVKQTMKMRGFSATTSLFTYQTYGNVFALLFIKVIRKAQHIQQSMITRGFHGEIYLLQAQKLVMLDYALALLVVMMILLKGLGI